MSVRKFSNWMQDVSFLTWVNECRLPFLSCRIDVPGAGSKGAQGPGPPTPPDPNFETQIFLANVTPNARCRQNLPWATLTKVLDPHLCKLELENARNILFKCCQFIKFQYMRAIFLSKVCGAKKSKFVEFPTGPIPKFVNSIDTHPSARISSRTKILKTTTIVTQSW